MLASIGDAVGAAAPAACLPKNVPELERSGLHFPTRSPSRYRKGKMVLALRSLVWAYHRSQIVIRIF
jgi:hypothetical protein